MELGLIENFRIAVINLVNINGGVIDNSKLLSRVNQIEFVFESKRIIKK